MSLTERIVPDDVIQINAVADVALLPILRMVPETLALMVGLDVDRAADLALAVDQICTDLIENSASGARLSLDVRPLPTVVTVVAGAHTTSDAVPDADSFGWRVLQTLTDRILVRRSDDEGGDRYTEIEFAMLRRNP